MNPRFLLFMAEADKARGGYGDCEGAFATQSEAIDAATEAFQREPEASRSDLYAHIVDIQRIPIGSWPAIEKDGAWLHLDLYKQYLQAVVCARDDPSFFKAAKL